MTNQTHTTLNLALILAIGCTASLGCDSNDDATDDGSGQDTTATGADDGADDGVDDGADDGVDDGADDGVDDGPDDGVDDGPDDGVDDDGTDDSGTDDDGTDDGTTVDCTDQMILDLGLVDGTVSAGGSVDSNEGGDWVSNVDATAGGIAEAANNPWLYLRFSSEGLTKVELDDLQALDSTEWDIATKRFGIRLNSGVSGPSTVTAALLADIDYTDVTELPASAALLEESFYDAQCTLIDDGSGQGAPNYTMTPWWFYPGCVGTTGTPFVIELADGSHVKFVVEAYYEQGQQTCNSDGAMGMGSANYTWRWAYLAQ